jgi:hypothetical protein
LEGGGEGIIKLQYRKYTNALQKKYIEYYLCMRLQKKKLNAIFLANAKSNFGAIFWLFYGIFRIFWKNIGFPCANEL